MFGLSWVYTYVFVVIINMIIIESIHRECYTKNDKHRVELPSNLEYIPFFGMIKNGVTFKPNEGDKIIVGSKCFLVNLFSAIFFAESNVAK